MHRFVAIAIAVALVVSGSGSASGKTVDLAVSPNPATLGGRVRHDVGVGASARLDVWVSASGFESPGLGTLPPGGWSLECCPPRTAGTPAWHFRSSSIVVPGVYRFGAVARMRGTWLSTAVVGGSAASVGVRVR